MQIQLNTDSQLKRSVSLSDAVESIVGNKLRHFEKQVTRVEVHLSDENSQKGDDRDKRCVMEARLEGLQPVVVSHQAETFEHALEGAAEKLKASLEKTIGKLRHH